MKSGFKSDSEAKKKINISGIEGKPYLNIKGINMENIENIDISLSHCKEYAIAMVSILYK